MKKAKTNKKIFTIFSAVLGVVFAFLTGFTYCATSLNLSFGQVPNSTAAYLANQEYRIINDTTNNPVLFSEGAHNFEVALQYSFDYSFDVRLKYSLSWTGGASTDNVILHFADRDNIIYDEEYIYLADAVPAGNGKINIIAGVDFVDPTLKEYFGKKLEISIDEVKVYKEQPSYDGEHALMKKITINEETQEKTTTKLTGPASQAWLQYKKNKTTKDTASAYVLMYNYRRDYDHGVSFPGLESAYKKPVGSDSYVTGSIWAGGNRAYAGTGMFVIAGSENLELEVQVAGIWRSDKTPTALSTENSVQYNYTNDWNFKNYSADKLWETRTFKHYITARTACYIEINDSIEITSAGMETVLAKDSYRLVTNSIVLNPSLGDDATRFTYLEKPKTNNSEPEASAAAETVILDGYISFKQIKANVNVADTAKYQQEDVSVINTSSYINGLYNTLPAGGKQAYNTNLSLINNTNQAQEVKLDIELWYHISNSKTKLYDSSNKRASELIGTSFTKPFNGDETTSQLYYSYSAQTNYLTETTSSFTVKLEPYASVNLLTSYSVAQALGEYIETTFDDPKTEDKDEYYDVWTYLVPSFGTVESTATSLLTLETTQTETATIVSVKNNSNSKVSGITLSNFSIRALGAVSFALENGANAPADWDASYWKYYYADNDDSPITTKQTYQSGVFWKRTQVYGVPLQISDANKLNSEVSVGANITYSGSLLPGESVEILTFATTSQVVVAGNVVPNSISTLTEIEIINNGTSDACIVNYSSNSYYLKLAGDVTGSKFEKFDDDSTNSYYIGVVRPGQMIKVNIASEITIAQTDKIVVSGAYAESVFPENSWSTKAKAAMASYFNMNKSQTNS